MEKVRRVTSQPPAPAQGIAAMAMGYEMQMLTNPHQFMSYGYVGMNPMRYNDPNGLIFGAIGNFFGGVGRAVGNFAVNAWQIGSNFVTGNGFNTNAQVAQQRVREAEAQRAIKQKTEAPISSGIGSFVSTVGRGLGSGAKKALEWFIGDNYGQAWRELLGGRSAKTMTGDPYWKLPASISSGLEKVFEQVKRDMPIDTANGMHGWHAGSNAMAVEKTGILGLPFVLAYGIAHETPIDWKAFKTEYKNQGAVNQFLDSTMDIVANVFGVTVGTVLPDSISVTAAIKLGHYIPGPGDPAREVGGKHKPYNGNPTDNWGPYTTTGCQ